MGAHRDSTKNPVRMSPPERDGFDRRVREAVRRLRRNVKAAPFPRWRWEDVEQLRYNPLAVAADMIDGAVASGATEDDCYAMVTVLADHIARHFPQDVLPLREALKVETAREGAANEAQIRLVCEPDSESALIEAEEKTAQDVEGARLVLASIQDARRRLQLRRCGPQQSGLRLTR